MLVMSPHCNDCDVVKSMQDAEDLLHLQCMKATMLALHQMFDGMTQRVSVPLELKLVTLTSVTISSD